MRFAADSNIVAQAVRALRALGHDVAYAAERATDPGDEALLADAHVEGRVFLTKDQDIGTLVHRDARPYAGVLLLDNLGDAAAEMDMILDALSTHGDRLGAGAFLRVTESGVRDQRR